MVGRSCSGDIRESANTRRRSSTRGIASNYGEWSFPDSPLRGVYVRNEVYAGIWGWKPFEPWLSAIEGLCRATVWRAASDIPAEWCNGQKEELDRLTGLCPR
jgi:hypothetical protein